MKIANLYMQQAVNDETDIAINVKLVATDTVKPLARGRWFEDKILEWSDAAVLYAEWDLVNNKLTITI